MVLTNAERQARYRQRLKALAAAGVTPDDIDRARRIVFEDYAADQNNRAGTWEEFVERCRKPKNRANWRDMLPEGTDPWQYEDFSREDAELLAKVGAVVEAINRVAD